MPMEYVMTTRYNAWNGQTETSMTPWWDPSLKELAEWERVKAACKQACIDKSGKVCAYLCRGVKNIARIVCFW